jgi:hypothetical protein
VVLKKSSRKVSTLSGATERAPRLLALKTRYSFSTTFAAQIGVSATWIEQVPKSRVPQGR